jgi:hypothetical protein
MPDSWGPNTVATPSPVQPSRVLGINAGTALLPLGLAISVEEKKSSTDDQLTLCTRFDFVFVSR